MADRIIHRHDTAENWSRSNPILIEGELGFIVDVNRVATGGKVGDGIHAWNDLPYLPVGSVAQELGQSTTVGMSQKSVTEKLGKTTIKVVTGDSIGGVGLIWLDLNSFFIDALLTGFPLGTEDSPKYYGANHIKNSGSKIIYIYEVDSAGAAIFPLNLMVTLSEIGRMGNLSILYGENTAKGVSAYICVNWSKIPASEFMNLKIKFAPDVYIDHYGVLWNYANDSSTKKTILDIEENYARETDVFKLVGIGESKKGSNRINPSKLLPEKYIGTSGQLLNGTTPYTTLDYTEWGDKTSCVAGMNGAIVSKIYSLAQYDANKVFIPGSYVGVSQTNTVSKVTGAVYFRISYATTGINQLNWGTAILPYEKFNDSAIVNKLHGEIDATFKPDITDEGLLDLIGSKKTTEATVIPTSIYTVCNDSRPNGTLSLSRNYSSFLYVDHFINLATKKKVRFSSNQSDKVCVFSPISEDGSTVNGGQTVLKTNVTLNLTGDIVDTPVTFQHVSTLSNATKDSFPKVLCIGDSVTMGFLANYPLDLTVDNPKQYWAFVKKFFELDKADFGGGHDCLMVGAYTNGSFRINDQTIRAFAEGRGGWKTSNYLYDQTYLSLPNYFYNEAATGSVKFSLRSYLNKYKTLADDGVTRLVVGSTAGTAVTNVMAYDVCTPTHIVLALGFNDVQANWLADTQLLINSIKSEYPDIIIIVTLFDASGSYFLELYPEFTDSANMMLSYLHNKMWNLINSAKSLESPTDRIYFCPSYFVQPTAWGVPCRSVNAPENMVDDRFTLNTRWGSGGDYHPNNFAHCAWGYQLYSLIKYSLAL